MCTLTIVPFEGGVQLGCNRDERLARPAARAPEVHLAGDLLSVFPTDAPGGGTWIGVNERGLVGSLLNRALPGDRPAAERLRCSRGVIVRHLLGAADIDHAIGRVTALPIRAFDPFTIVILQGRQLAVVTSDGRDYVVTIDALERPACFTSSSLGDTQVLAPRLSLFERTVARAREPLLMQAAFHLHRWPDRPHLSVDMMRDDAATVSRTWLTVTSDRARLAYEPLTARSTGGGTVVTEITCASSQPSSSRPS